MEEIKKLKLELAKLEAKHEELKNQFEWLTLPNKWVGQPVWYCNGYKDCCEYEINYITKVDLVNKRIKVNCDHQSEWLPLDIASVEEWIKEGRDRRDNPDR